MKVWSSYFKNMSKLLLSITTLLGSNKKEAMYNGSTLPKEGSEVSVMVLHGTIGGIMVFKYWVLTILAKVIINLEKFRAVLKQVYPSEPWII